MKRFASIPRRFWNAFRNSNQEIAVNLLFTQFALPTRLAADGATRRGLSIDDPSPLYQMDPAILAALYAQQGRDRGELFNVGALYGDFTPLHAAGQAPVTGSDALDVGRARVAIATNAFRLHADLRRHREETVVFFRRTGRQKRLPDQSYENNVTPRVTAFDPTAARIGVQLASYEDQIATNLSMDVAVPWLAAEETTIRRHLARPEGAALPPLAGSMLANTLGVAAFVYADDGTPLFRRRDVAKVGGIPQGGLHCAVSGVCELPPDATRGGTYGFDALAHGMRHEMFRELALDPEEYDLHPVGFARELPRGGKPQLFSSPSRACPSSGSPTGRRPRWSATST
jgi:hypothetical protein